MMFNLYICNYLSIFGDPCQASNGECNAEHYVSGLQLKHICSHSQKLGLNLRLLDAHETLHPTQFQTMIWL